MNMIQEDYAQKIRDSFKDGNSRSYHSLFPLVADLRTQTDTRGFMKGYVEVMKVYIQDKLDRDEKGIVFDGIKAKLQDGKWSLEDAAKYLTADNLPLLADIYEANTDRKPQRSWYKVLDDVCPA